MTVTDLTITDLIIVYSLLIIPIFISFYLKLGLISNIVISIARMSIQLFLVGLYLDFIFKLNSLWVNILWMFVMVIVANSAILRQANLKTVKSFPFSFLGLAAGTSLSLVVFLFIISPTPIYDARYAIPIFGMILGNSMRGNVIAIERFYSSLRKNEKEFVTYLMLGADLKEAVRPFLKDALLAATKSQLAAVATIGIVSLPGMMTGQILGGSFPMTAIKYQIAIMVCILSAKFITTTMNLFFTRVIAFDSFGMLKKDIFRS